MTSRARVFLRFPSIWGAQAGFRLFATMAQGFQTAMHTAPCAISRHVIQITIFTPPAVAGFAVRKDRHQCKSDHEAYQDVHRAGLAPFPKDC